MQFELEQKKLAEGACRVRQQQEEAARADHERNEHVREQLEWVQLELQQIQRQQEVKRVS